MSTLHPAIQHSKCLHAVCLMQDALLYFVVACENQKGVLPKIANMQKWADACKKHLEQKSKLSAGAQREIIAKLKCINRHIANAKTPFDIYHAWCALFWYAATLLQDCKNVYHNATKKAPCFRWLAMTSWTFALALQKSSPDAMEIGTNLYLKME